MAVSHAGSLLGGHSGRGLPGQGVHGPQELVGDAASLAQPAEQRPVHRGRVVADRVLAREEQPRDGLWGDNTTRGYSCFSVLQQMNEYIKNARRPLITARSPLT